MDLGSGKEIRIHGSYLAWDDLYARQPFCEEARKQQFHFLFTCKSSSHSYLYEWVEAAEVGVDITEAVHNRWTGKERLYERYRFMNDVPIRDGEDALRGLKIPNSGGRAPEVSAETISFQNTVTHFFIIILSCFRFLLLDVCEVLHRRFFTSAESVTKIYDNRKEIFAFRLQLS